MLQLKTETTRPLAERIELSHAKIVEPQDDMPRHVTFEIKVDGRSVNTTLEWLDEDYDLVAIDCHLDANKDWRDAAYDAVFINEMDEETVWDEVYEVVHTGLREILAALKTSYAPAVVAWKYGTAKQIPLSAVGNALLDDLAHDGTIRTFTESVGVEDVPGIQSLLVPTYSEDGLRTGDMFAVIVPENCRAGLRDNGDVVWVDADNIEDALLIYERGGE